MRHNPDNIPDGIKIWEFYPEFKRHIDFHKVDEYEWEQAHESFSPDEDDIESMLRFVVYMVSQESPYYLESDYESRVKACMRSAGIMPSSVLAKMIRDRHWWYRRMLTTYLKAFAKLQFSSWLSYRTMAYNLMEIMMARPDPNSTDIKSFVKAATDASGELEGVMRLISGLEEQLFSTSEIGEMVALQALFDGVNTAESYARDFDVQSKFK